MRSAPLLPCRPRSDANAPRDRYPGAGAAFVELQFYPPGFAPFADSISCDNKHWCSALNIDSLECSGNGSGPCNPNCAEPVNFGFIQTNGVPAGPPSPQLANLATFTPNSRTRLMNPGDKITIKDTPKSFEPDDSPCFQAGDTHNGTTQPNIVTGCDVYLNAIGDLEYDGTPYYPDWPDSLTADRFPSPFLQQQPTTVGGRRYSSIQFMTDASATEFNTNCNLATATGCVLPPKGPGSFYPFWTLARVGGRCVWEFGNMHNGNSYGRDRQYAGSGQAP